MNVVVHQLVGANAITLEDGQTVHDQILPVLRENGRVVLDFAGVLVYATPFLNAAVGQLVREIPAEVLNSHLQLLNLSATGRDVLRRVVENAKRFADSPKARDAFERGFGLTGDDKG